MTLIKYGYKLFGRFFKVPTEKLKKLHVIKLGKNRGH